MGFFSNDDGVSESTHTSDISRANRRISALENRIRLLEETIAADPNLTMSYGNARAKMAERRLKDDLSGSGGF
jgi:hypothetical protein